MVNVLRAATHSRLTIRRKAYVQDLADRPLFQQFDAAEDDLAQLANDADGDRKGRIKVISDGSKQSYMVGVYNGWSVSVEREVQDSVLISQPGLYFHATTWGHDTQIAEHGLEAMNRNEIQFPPFPTTNRKSAYVMPWPVRKTHTS